MKKDLREQIYRKYNGKCAYCGCSLEYKDMQLDHIKAKYLGGTNEEANYMASCRACNFYKATLDIDRFRQKVATVPQRLNELFIFKLALKYGLVELKDKEVKFYFEQMLDDRT